MVGMYAHRIPGQLKRSVYSPGSYSSLVQIDWSGEMQAKVDQSWVSWWSWLMSLFPIQRLSSLTFTLRVARICWPVQKDCRKQSSLRWYPGWGSNHPKARLVTRSWSSYLTWFNIPVRSDESTRIWWVRTSYWTRNPSVRLCVAPKWWRSWNRWSRGSSIGGVGQRGRNPWQMLEKEIHLFPRIVAFPDE